MTPRSFTSAFPLALEGLDTSAALWVTADEPEANGMEQQIFSLILKASFTITEPPTANTSCQC